MANSRGPAMYGIRPVLDRGGRRSPAWEVSLMRQGEVYARFFSMSTYGSLETALIAAKAWRDEITAHVPQISKADFCNIIKKSNTSNFAGVYLMRRRNRKVKGATKIDDFWQAREPYSAGRMRTKSFSISRYGYEEAYRLAVEARKAFLSEVEGPLRDLPIVPASLAKRTRCDRDAQSPSKAQARPRVTQGEDRAPSASAAARRKRRLDESVPPCYDPR
jgi:hypothetical protein